MSAALASGHAAMDRASASWIRVLLFGGAALAWVGPWLPAHVRRAIDLAFAPICHQRPERTLVFAGHAMSVCSRCAGVYAGIALGALLAWPRLSSGRHRSVLGGAVLLLLLDIVTQDLGMHPVWHAARLLTGGACGYAASAWLAAETGRLTSTSSVGSAAIPTITRREAAAGTPTAWPCPTTRTRPGPGHCSRCR